MTRDHAWFVAAAALAAYHVADDAFISPEPGTTATDHLLTAGLPLATITGAVALAPRLRPGARALVAVVLGSICLEVAGLAVVHSLRARPAGDDFSAFAAGAAGIVLVALAVRWLWRSRKPRGHRVLRRLGLAAASVVGSYWILAPTAAAVFATHRPREAATPVVLGRPTQNVAVPTSDGLVLRGRYVRSLNGAAVIVFPGSISRAPQARALVRHGYGVLMLDMRGYGSSEGDPNAFGWGSTKDVDAGIAFLRRRAEVEQIRIGGLGFSVGGEQMLEAAAQNHLLRAVASEGAGQRSVREVLLLGPRGWLGLPAAAIQTVAVAALSGHLPPPALDDVVGRIAPRPVFLIYAAHGAGDEDLQPTFFDAAGEPKQLWKVERSGHTGGYAADPVAYERRVVGFFDKALLGAAPTTTILKDR